MYIYIYIYIYIPLTYLFHNVKSEPLIHLTRVNLKKNEQYPSCKLSFIWGKMRTAAQATAHQTALRNCCLEGRLVCL